MRYLCISLVKVNSNYLKHKVGPRQPCCTGQSCPQSQVQYKRGPERLTRLGNSNVLRLPVAVPSIKISSFLCCFYPNLLFLPAPTICLLFFDFILYLSFIHILIFFQDFILFPILSLNLILSFISFLVFFIFIFQF